MLNNAAAAEQTAGRELSALQHAAAAVLLQISFKPKKQPKPGTELSTTVNCYALFDFKTVTIFSTHKSDYVSKNQWT
jgi:hypothetical protein